MTEQYVKSLDLIVGNLMVLIKKKGCDIPKSKGYNHYHSQCQCDACLNYNFGMIRKMFPISPETIILKDIKNVCVSASTNPWQICNTYEEDCRPHLHHKFNFSYPTDGHFKIKHLSDIMNKITNGRENLYIIGDGNTMSIRCEIYDDILVIKISTTSEEGSKKCEHEQNFGFSFGQN